jgi:hypothetical protein
VTSGPRKWDSLRKSPTLRGYIAFAGEFLHFTSAPRTKTFSVKRCFYGPS